MTATGPILEIEKLRTEFRSGGRWHPAVRRTAGALSRLRQTTVDVTRRGWPLLTLGMASYLSLQFALFWACLAKAPRFEEVLMPL